MAAPTVLTRAQARVAARLLEELAGVYRGEPLGSLAAEMVRTLDSLSSSYVSCIARKRLEAPDEVENKTIAGRHGVAAVTVRDWRATFTEEGTGSSPR